MSILIKHCFDKVQETKIYKRSMARGTFKFTNGCSKRTVVEATHPRWFVHRLRNSSM